MKSNIFLGFATLLWHSYGNPSSKVFTMGFKTHFKTHKVQACVCSHQTALQRNTHKVLFMLSLNVRMGVKTKYLVKREPHLNCTKEVK